MCTSVGAGRESRPLIVGLSEAVMDCAAHVFLPNEMSTSDGERLTSQALVVLARGM